MNVIINTKLLSSLLKSSTSRHGALGAMKSTLSKESVPVDPEDENSERYDVTTVMVDDEIDPDAIEAEINRKRNKSRLLPQHQRLLQDSMPYDEPQSWIHTTLRYQRTQFGRYGLASNVNPRLCFKTQTEQIDQDEYERVAMPFSLEQMIETNRKQKAEMARKLIERDEMIGKKFEKLDQWIKEVNDKIAKKEAEAIAAKERKNRLVEEVRREFGFKLDTRDDRFKELVAQKEKEDRKKQKEEKRKLKEEKMLAKLQQTAIIQKAAAEEKPLN